MFLIDKIFLLKLIGRVCCQFFFVFSWERMGGLKVHKNSLHSPNSCFYGKVFGEPDEQSQIYLCFVVARKRLILIEGYHQANAYHLNIFVFSWEDES